MGQNTPLVALKLQCVSCNGMKSEAHFLKLIKIECSITHHRYRLLQITNVFGSYPISKVSRYSGIKMLHFLKVFLLLMVRNIELIALNTLRPKQNVRHFADNILKCIFLNESVIHAFRLRFHWSLFLRFDLTNSNIGSDNGLVPARRHG